MLLVLVFSLMCGASFSLSLGVVQRQQPRLWADQNRFQRAPPKVWWNWRISISVRSETTMRKLLDKSRIISFRNNNEKGFKKPKIISKKWFKMSFSELRVRAVLANSQVLFIFYILYILLFVLHILHILLFLLHVLYGVLSLYMFCMTYIGNLPKNRDRKSVS